MRRAIRIFFLASCVVWVSVFFVAQLRSPLVTVGRLSAAAVSHEFRIAWLESRWNTRFSLEDRFAGSPGVIHLPQLQTITIPTTGVRIIIILPWWLIGLVWTGIFPVVWRLTRQRPSGSAFPVTEAVEHEKATR
jgi:hypothetical protein